MNKDHNKNIIKYLIFCMYLYNHYNLKTLFYFIELNLNIFLFNKSIPTRVYIKRIEEVDGHQTCSSFNKHYTTHTQKIVKVHFFPNSNAFNYLKQN